MQEVEDRAEDGEPVRPAGRVEPALEHLGRHVAEEQETLQREDVLDMDGGPEIVRVAAHQLVGEEEPDERHPVPEEQAPASQEDGGQAERDEQHVGGDRDATDDHQHRQESDVPAQETDEEPVVASPEAIPGAEGRLRGHALGRAGLVAHVACGWSVVAGCSPAVRVTPLVGDGPHLCAPLSVALDRGVLGRRRHQQLVVERAVAGSAGRRRGA